jgi:hypothetical protein
VTIIDILGAALGIGLLLAGLTVTAVGLSPRSMLANDHNR